MMPSSLGADLMAFIKQARTPTLILHGGADVRVPPSQAQELYMGLRKNGVPVEYGSVSAGAARIA